MNEKKLMQLSSMAASVIATLEFQQRQLQEFQPPLRASSHAIQSNLEVISGNLVAISANPQPLGKSDIELLAKLKINLQKIGQEISRDIERPAMQFKKDLDHQHAIINDKLAKELIKPSTFSLDPLRNAVKKALDLVRNNNLDIDKILQETNNCQQKFGHTTAQLHRLNLPNEICSATKEAVKLTKDLNLLQNQLLNNPHGRELYQAQFLPLFDALDKLSQFSELRNACSASTRDPRPGI